MKCTSCNTFVHKIPINWKCPHCAERLPDPSKWYLFWEGFNEYLEDKGAVFWSVVLAILLIAVGIPEMLLGSGFLISYITSSLLIAIAGIFFGGMLFDMYFKVMLPLRIPYGSNFIIRERAVIRNFRKGTNLAVIAAIITFVIWCGPQLFLKYFPSFFVILGWYLALAWSIAGLFLDGRMAQDVRFRFYMERLGIVNLNIYRRIATIVIASLVIITIGHYILMSIPNLWNDLKNTAFVGRAVHLFSEYFAWLL